MRATSPSVVVLGVLAVVLALLVGVDGIYIYRSKEDIAYLTFTEGGIIQNLVKCDPEIKDTCKIDPTVIISPYTQTLAAYTLTAVDILKNDPKYHETARVLIIGLGPAALGRFLHHYFPNMQIDHVEINQALVDQINSTLPLPVSPKFKIYVNDALRFVSNEISLPASEKRKYDIIIHDAFDGVGPVMALNTLPFLNNLRKLVENNAAENGIIISNFWALNLTLAKETAAKYKQVFGNVRMTGVPRGEQNCIFIAHSMTRKDDLVCTDNVCKTKRSKASRSKVSPVCQDVENFKTIAQTIKTTHNMTLDIAQVIDDSWTLRPLPEETYMC